MPIQEVQYFETLVPTHPLHAKGTALYWMCLPGIAGFWQTITPIYTIIKCKLVGIEVPKILPLCSKRLPGPLVGYIFWAYPFKRCNILKPLSPFTLFMLRIVLCNAIQCLPLVFASLLNRLQPIIAYYSPHFPLCSLNKNLEIVTYTFPRK